MALSKGFWLGETEVTQELWKEVMGGNPSKNQGGGNYPVENVSWNDCQKFIEKLNARTDVAPAGLRFALPTEAQWEYACRAGTMGDYGGTGSLDVMGWYSGNWTHPVGEKGPNAWKLRDMHENVLEWCADWYDEGYYARSPATDPPGPSSGGCRVLRGGSYWDLPGFCRSASRGGGYPGTRRGNYGVRLLAFQDD